MTAAERSLAEDLRALADESRAYATAEIEFQKTRAGFAGKRIVRLAIFAALSLGFIWLAMITLPVGLLIALAPQVGIWPAIGIAVGAFLVLGAICALVAMAIWRRTVRLLTGKG